MVLGLAGGLPGGWFSLAELGPSLGFDGRRELRGVVEARRIDEGRVRLMLRSEDGESVLATFTERPSDIAALARVGDTLVLQLDAPYPIVDEPTVLRVEPAGEERPDPFDPDVVDLAGPGGPGVSDADSSEAESSGAESSGAEPSEAGPSDGSASSPRSS